MTTYKDIINNNNKLSPSQLMTLFIANKNTVNVRNLLSRDLRVSDKGEEVGSTNYISQSTKYFIKTKALQSNSFLLHLTKESTTPIRPQSFKNFDLKKNDILISKDSNIGEVAILDKDLPNYMVSGAFYKLPVIENKYYLFALLKHKYFKDQLSLLAPKGVTIKHAKTLFLDCKIPLPKNNHKEIMNYVELLTQAIINKEKEVSLKHKKILKSIEKELLRNQKNIKSKTETVTFKNLQRGNRVDAGYYCEDYNQKQSLVEDYKYGAKELEKWGYSIKRGQNLQVSQIRESIYSDLPRNNFYTLIRPTNFSDFGTVEKFEYLGNSDNLSTIESGDVIFSVEGTVGKSVLFINPEGDWITNIHGIILRKKDYSLQENAFVSCFLRYLRHIGIFDYISVGGQGGSLAKKYFKDIKVSIFPKEKQKEIADLYHLQVEYPKSLDKNNFLSKDTDWNKKAGIIQIDESIKNTKKHLNKIIDKIINNKKMDCQIFRQF